MTTVDFDNFAALHQPGKPLFLVNAWDGASARCLHSAGHSVIGTTSLGTAYAGGQPDGEGRTFADVLALVEQCTRLGIPVSADIENGFSDNPDDVVGYVREIRSAGAVGINIEDGRADDTLIPVEVATEKIKAISRAAPGLFINARTDPYWIKDEGSDRDKHQTAISRAGAYIQAGAHGIFVPGITGQEPIRAVVSEIPAPVNVLFKPGGPTLSELASAGAARVSTGSFLFRLSLGSIETAARAIQADEPVASESAPSYAAINTPPQ
ncbi:isocitrate lyase/PEP mutase family protein [Arthrobacter monumenti]